MTRIVNILQLKQKQEKRKKCETERHGNESEKKKTRRNKLWQHNNMQTIFYPICFSILYTLCMDLTDKFSELLMRHFNDFRMLKTRIRR